MLLTTFSPPPRTEPVHPVIFPSRRSGRRLGLANILDPTNASQRPISARRNAMAHIWFDLDSRIAGRIARRLTGDFGDEEEEEKDEKDKEEDTTIEEEGGDGEISE